MARYATTVKSHLTQDEAFAYMADFTNARFWDPSVTRAEREGDGPVGAGTVFLIVARFGGRDVALRYTIVTYEPPKLVVLEARKSIFVSRDTVTVEAAPDGSVVRYDALLAFRGAARLLDPLMQRIFNGVGANATAGMEKALNP